MERSKEKVTLEWSEREQDWIVRYPQWSNRNPRILGNSFFTMISKFEEFMSKDFMGEPTDFTNFRDYLNSAGFDPDTFTISVNAKMDNNNN